MSWQYQSPFFGMIHLSHALVLCLRLSKGIFHIPGRSPFKFSPPKQFNNNYIHGAINLCTSVASHAWCHDAKTFWCTKENLCDKIFTRKKIQFESTLLSFRKSRKMTQARTARHRMDQFVHSVLSSALTRSPELILTGNPE